MTIATQAEQKAVTAPGRSRLVSFWAAALSALEANRALQFVLLLLVAFAVRWPVFGEWSYHTDEQFYSLVGQRMLEGKLLYVDIWDRKGPVLFLIYAACALISSNVLSYQIAATISATLSAFLIVRLAARITAVRYAVLAGIAYYALLAHFGGGGGQSPVFYNTLILCAAHAIVSNIDQLRAGHVPPAIYWGVACAGLAIATKATAIIEGAFFGITILALLWRSPCSRLRLAVHTFALALLALSPTLITFLYFASIGHSADIWNALVTSNLHRTYETPYGRFWRSGVLLGRLGLMLIFAVIGWRLAVREQGRSELLAFLGTWAAVALGGVLLFPNIYLHYALPIAPPLCILSARYFARGRIGLIGLAIVLIFNFAVGKTFDLAGRRAALNGGTDLATYVRAETPHHKLLVYSSANYLYALAGAPLPSRIVFAHHFFDNAESGVTGMDEHAELARVLRLRPETIVYETNIDHWTPQNLTDNDAVRHYLHSCTNARSFILNSFEGPFEQRVYSHCGNR